MDDELKARTLQPNQLAKQAAQSIKQSKPRTGKQRRASRFPSRRATPTEFSPGPAVVAHFPAPVPFRPGRVRSRTSTTRLVFIHSYVFYLFHHPQNFVCKFSPKQRPSRSNKGVPKKMLHKIKRLKSQVVARPSLKQSQPMN